MQIKPLPKPHRPSNGRRYKLRPGAFTLYDSSRKSLPSVPRVMNKVDSPFQSDSGNSFLHGRDVRHLLQSTGHFFRDGRFSGDDDPFHVFREEENPGLGARLSFQGGDYYRDFIVRDDHPDPVTYNWVPSVARGFIANDAFSTYDTPLPEVVVPVSADFTLTINGLGTDFIRRFRPGNPVANLGEFIIELRDLPQLPRFLESRAKHFRDLGSEYLNVEFGWKPFISDLQKLAKLQMTIEDRLRKLVDGNGIRIKRRSKHEFRTISSVADIDGNLSRPFGELSDPSIGGDELIGPYQILGPVPFNYFDPFMSGNCIYHAAHKHTTESWFVGEYFYYVPDIGSDRWTALAIAELYGIQPHPAVIYKTYPWTWLADWFLNVGDIVSNLTSNAVDSEALRGSYVMHKDLEVYEITCDSHWDDFSFGDPLGNQWIFVPAGSAHCKYSNLRLSKLRRQASPFGFGLRPGNFTLRQNAILLALATSRKAHVS